MLARPARGTLPSPTLTACGCCSVVTRLVLLALLLLLLGTAGSAPAPAFVVVVVLPLLPPLLLLLPCCCSLPDGTARVGGKRGATKGVATLRCLGGAKTNWPGCTRPGVLWPLLHGPAPLPSLWSCIVVCASVWGRCSCGASGSESDVVTE